MLDQLPLGGEGTKVSKLDKQLSLPPPPPCPSLCWHSPCHRDAPTLVNRFFYSVIFKATTKSGLSLNLCLRILSLIYLETLDDHLRYNSRQQKKKKRERKAYQQLWASGVYVVAIASGMRGASAIRFNLFPFTSAHRHIPRGCYTLIGGSGKKDIKNDTDARHILCVYRFRAPISLSLSALAPCVLRPHHRTNALM